MLRGRVWRGRRVLERRVGIEMVAWAGVGRNAGAGGEGFVRRFYEGG